MKWFSRNQKNFQSQAISLDIILSGRTCSPLSLEDFRNYLVHTEFSDENLEFLEWMHGYRAAWCRLEKGLQELSPMVTAPYQPFVTLSSEGGTKEKDDAQADNEKNTTIVQKTIFTFADFPYTSAAPSSSPSTNGLPWEMESGIVPSYSNRRSPSAQLACGSPETRWTWSTPRSPESIVVTVNHDSQSEISSLPPLLPASLSYPTPVTQPYRAEVNQAISRHFLPGSSRELNVDCRVRIAICQDALTTTHPSIFNRAERDIQNLLESTSLQRFLDIAVRNIDTRTMKIRWCTSVFILLLGLGANVLLIALHYSRWWRLLTYPVFIWSLGCMASAHSGVCSYFTYRGLRLYQVHDAVDVANTESGVKKYRINKMHVLEPLVKQMQWGVLKRVTIVVWVVGTIMIGIALTIDLGFSF
ncbi:hypothetical protein BC936DRAFT_139363 [Jimgerdemannia flammicorona]|uniref:Uncharacterized protein n=2 Tax=Jimgerdemannia flammicorona TaxID=994334 RepID=A0A433DHS0_9FUNG|nr:hypothetical protein BC936DRAFT_139363 [Jimgerdemannia flammicorona]RUS30987.1 hypothetical protein BC938DRAFT_478652 [Jimgerdemannia flammicorona]